MSNTINCFLQIITLSDTFGPMKEAVIGLMEGLHMIWVLSPFYSTDEQMVPLLEKIAWILQQKVTNSLNVKTLFK